MPYKRRRIIKGPNKNDEKRARSQSNWPPLGNFFPELQGLTLDLQFTNPQGHILQEDHLEYGPNDPVSFMIPCPGGCGDGQTNLQAKIGSAVQQRLDSAEGRAECLQPLFSSTNLCSCLLVCQISLTYHPN